MRQIVDSTRIDHWFISTRRDAQELLPHLVRKLIGATVEPKAILSLKIPVGDEIGRPGYDGCVEVAGGTSYVPAGLSVWEMGTGDPQPKAEKDYATRCQDPKGIDPKSATFVFVSPHRWDAKEEWARNKTSEGKWKEVRALDSSDLAGWLEAAPIAARWLARWMGVPVEGMKDVDLYLAEFAAPCAVPISPDVVIGGRQIALKQFHEWIASSEPGITVEGESVEEVSAFIAAAVCRLSEEEREKVASRVLLVDEPSAMDYLSGLQTVHFIVPSTDTALRRARALRSSCIRIIVPCPRTAGHPAGTGPQVRLGQIRRQPTEAALKAAGVSSPRAEKAAMECKGSLTALLWMLSGDQGAVLPWVSGNAAGDLAPLALAGQWVADAEKDRAAIEELCGRSYKDIERAIASWTAPAGPLVRRGAIWDWLAWDFAWGCLAASMDRGVVDRFRTVAKKVLQEADPRFELPAADRWAAAVHGKAHPYSGHLRTGLVGSIAQMAIHAPDLQTVSGQSAADAIVRDLLGADTGSQKTAWLSLAPWLPDLAEASPHIFLEVFEAWTQDSDAVQAMFEEGGMFSSSASVHLLWALERLAWSSELLTRVTLAFGKLAAHAPNNNRSNSPSGSLTRIFLPWHPQTSADVGNRLDAIDVLRVQQPKVAWDLAVSLLPSGNETTFDTSAPRWRPWKPSDKPKTTVAEYWRVVEGIADRLLQWAGTEGARWEPLVQAHVRLIRTHPDLARRILDGLQHLDASSLPDADRNTVCDSIRGLLALYADLEDNDEGLKAEDLKPLGDVFEKLRPTEFFARNKWLFGSWPEFPGRRNMTFEEKQQHLEDQRREAVAAILAAQGIDGLLRFAETVERPEAIGFALARLDLDDPAEAELLNRTLGGAPTQEGNPVSVRLGLGFVSTRFSLRGPAWLDHVLAMAGVQWDRNRHTNLALGLPAEGPTWDRVEQFGPDAAKLYWAQARIFSLSSPERDGARAVRSLLAAGRSFSALDLIGMCLHQAKPRGVGKGAIGVPAELILQVLAETPKHDPKTEVGGRNLSMLSHHVGEILNFLESEGVDDNTLAGVEWTWLPALRHGRRGVKALQKALSESPQLFIDLLKLIYRGEKEEAHEVSEEDQARGRQAFDLLHAWTRVPGTVQQTPEQERSDGDIVFGRGEVNQDRLFGWAEEARRLANDCDRLVVCDLQIGEVLAYAPEDPDGRWPCKPVRNLIEKLASAEIERGLAIGICNKRGAFCRAKGGDQERALAAKFRRYAEPLHSRWPRTAGVLVGVADDYEREARLEDDREAFDEYE